MVASYALCSLDDAREYLQKAQESTDSDAVLETLINRASSAITTHCEREFIAVEDEARVFAYDGGGVLDLAPYDLRAVTSIEFDYDGTASQLEATSYRLRPKPSRHGVYQWITGLGIRRGGLSEVRITGDWGFASVPEDVRFACVLQVNLWFRRDVAAFATTFNLDEQRVERPEGLSSGVAGLLAPYRRVRVA